MADYFGLDEEVVQATDKTISLTFASPDGTPLNIANDDFYYKAEAGTTEWTTDTIVIAPAATVKSNSGLGVTDTVDFLLTDVLTDVDFGFYGHEILRKLASGLIEPVCRGTLTVTEARADAS